jgi:hypothetical protein
MGSCEASVEMRGSTRPSTHGYDGVDEQLCDINSLYSALEDDHHMYQFHFTEGMACSASMRVIIWSLVALLVNSLIAADGNLPVNFVIQNEATPLLQRPHPV